MVGMNFNLVPGGKYIDNQSEKISTLGNTIDVAYGQVSYGKGHADRPCSMEPGNNKHMKLCIVSDDQLHTPSKNHLISLYSFYRRLRGPSTLWNVIVAYGTNKLTIAICHHKGLKIYDETEISLINNNFRILED